MTVEIDTSTVDSADPILDLAGAAGLLQLGLDTTTDLIKRGELRAARVGTGRGQWRIRRSWVYAYLDRVSEST